MAQEVDFMIWVQKLGHEQALKAYNEWVFGQNPVYTEGDKYLFIHGEINSPATRQGEATVNPNTVIVVHVVGVNFIIGDTDTQNNQLNDDPKVSAACQFSARNEDRRQSVNIKTKGGQNWTDLTNLVEEVTYTPDRFTADPNNPDLKKWDVEMPEGPQRGAWASKLLLLKAPTDQVGKDFELKSHGTGIPPYQQKTHFEIKVR